MIATSTLLRACATVFVLLGTPVVGLHLARGSNAKGSISAPNAVIGAAPSAGVLESRPVRNDFAGVLLPPKMTNLAPKAEGRVESILVKVGQAVHQGDVVLRLDARQQRHELAQAKASLRASQAAAGAAASDMMAAQRRAARRNATVRVGGKDLPLVSGEEAAQAQFDARSASARAGSASASIAEAQAKVDALTLALEETEMKAPFDGIVTAVLFEPGMTVQTTDTLARIVGGSGLRVRFAIAEEDAAVLKGRTRARISFDSGVLFASVEQVSPEVEPTSRTFFVEGPVEGGDAACGAAGCVMVAGRGVRVSLEAGGGAVTPVATVLGASTPSEPSAAPAHPRRQGPSRASRRVSRRDPEP